MRYLRHILTLGSLGLGALLTNGCGGPSLSADPAIAAFTEASLSDVLRIESRPDGLFDVYCKDGRVEKGIPSDQIAKGNICNPVPPTSVFDPSYCSGPTMTQAQALGRFPAAATEVGLTGLRFAARQHHCTDLTGCDAWVEGIDSFTGPDLQETLAPFTGRYDPVETGSLKLALAGAGVQLGIYMTATDPTDGPLGSFYTSSALPTSATDTAALAFRRGDGRDLAVAVPNPSVWGCDDCFETFSGRLTNSCFQVLLTRTDTSSGLSHHVAEVALYARF
jgi:hypothetical protein